MSGLKKFLKYLSAFLVLLVLAGIGAYYLAKKFEPEVRNVVVGELNKHLAAPVKVGDINLSLLQRFPYASLRFSDVVVPEMKKDVATTDTLIDQPIGHHLKTPSDWLPEIPPYYGVDLVQPSIFYY